MIDRLEKKFNSLAISKTRKKNDKYHEVVFFNKDTKKWHRILSNSLGAPLNSKWEKPDEKIKAYTRRFGGIRNGQTVYLKEYDNCSIIAMTWPWKDKKHTTLKISMIKGELPLQ